MILTNRMVAGGLSPMHTSHRNGPDRVAGSTHHTNPHEERLRMTDPTLAVTFDTGRMYARERGGTPEVPSITTVLGVKDANLGWWEAVCAINAAFDDVESLKQIDAMPNGRDKWAAKREKSDWYKDAAARDRDAAAARGDFVHNYAESMALYTMGKATSADMARHEQLCREAGVMDYVASFHKFWEEWSPRPIMPEATVWNHEVGYAGTTDLLCEIDIPGHGPTVVIADYKTKKGLYQRNGRPKEHDLKPETGMQLVAASWADEVWIEGATPAEDKWIPWEHRPEVGIAIALAPDGYLVRQYNIYDPVVWGTFKALCAAWRWSQRGASTMGPRLMSGPSGLVPPTPRPLVRP